MNILEIFIGAGLTIAGIIRLTNTNIRNGEMDSLPFMNEPLENLLALFELLGIYFVLFTTRRIRNLYLTVYCIGTLGVAAYYLPSHTPSEIAELITFKNNLSVIFYHVLICILMLVIIVGK
jgi:hypothetical protein